MTLMEEHWKTQRKVNIAIEQGKEALLLIKDVNRKLDELIEKHEKAARISVEHPLNGVHREPGYDFTRPVPVALYVNQELTS
jgi:hypothetical protein